MIRVRFSLLPALLAGACLFMSRAHATDPFLGAETQAKVDAVALAAIASGRTAGLAVGVVRDNQLVFNRSYGFANLELGVPVNASTSFRLASLTKQFTAAAVLLLAEQRKLSLDDKLSKFYPQFPRGPEITLRHLLNHTSGIRDYTEVMGAELGRQNGNKAEFAQRLAGVGFDFDPGTKYHYSNSGYYLLGQIIETVSGKSFAEFTRVSLFERLGMMETAVDDEADVAPFRASGYSPAKGTPSGYANAPFLSMSVVYAAGATRSTVADLAKWNVALYGGKVMSAESFKVMTTEGRLNDGSLASTAIWRNPAEPARPPVPGFSPFAYTMGLHTGSLDGHRLMGHEGGIFGFNTMMEHYLDDGFMLIVLANTDGGAGRTEMEIARVLFAALGPAKK